MMFMLPAVVVLLNFRCVAHCNFQIADQQIYLHNCKFFQKECYKNIMIQNGKMLR
jgi:hypothetical protein